MMYYKNVFVFDASAFIWIMLRPIPTLENYASIYVHI